MFGISRWLYIDFSKAGVKIPSNGKDETQIVPFVRIVEFARKFFERKLKKDDWMELKSKVF